MVQMYTDLNVVVVVVVVVTVIVAGAVSEIEQGTRITHLLIYFNGVRELSCASVGDVRSEIQSCVANSTKYELAPRPNGCSSGRGSLESGVRRKYGKQWLILFVFLATKTRKHQITLKLNDQSNHRTFKHPPPANAVGQGSKKI
ncbi:MAG: hypothetical protein V2A54_13130 [Bacteroidota bacterium]